MKTDILNSNGLKEYNYGVSTGSKWFAENSFHLTSSSPITGEALASVSVGNSQDFEQIKNTASAAFEEWHNWPAPKRGEIVRQIGELLRERKESLGRLVSLEMGKSLQEGLGEVQEMIDIADFAVGLSRQLYGLSMHSERPEHRMMEQYHPLGIVGIISAFNFPVAVWSWNAFLAWVCGNTCIWKPSEKTPLCAIACQQIVAEVFIKNGVPEGVSCLITGNREVGEWIAQSPDIPLVSATGSTAMGKSVAVAVAARLGKSLLELGGNNAIIITPDADLKIALPSVVFGAVGTAGQRCTTTRRLIVHEKIYDSVKEKLIAAYQRLKIGDPLDPANHLGPVIDQDAVNNYVKTIGQAQKEGGQLLTPAGVVSGCFVRPTIIEVQQQSDIVRHETFAPILYIMKYSSLDEAIRLQNEVPQGLSSSIMTLNIREAEQFLSAKGSDCGIANVNIGTSGAEIGGAFGGEKETGGGRESGSDAWKNYMRRQTCTINFGSTLPLAQGIRFDF
ncbi:L-piperidine-6-carboxylate dehydrogenase [Pinibacter aurantiacus]|uniref:Aldehyde dehydrogenase family protein n=1 Tax=Pinibacter aurantiacus TaxID=2851599 RepID=A0A9E2SCP0_9BACT|nr:aldehyde dehydrogenase family protein [Pinibacter aurantiacus]MBV4358897.1 aldehyde dehydrogenase family protein [Pinibacter aurantiacus]